MMKESDLAYCGLNCSKCPVLIATIRDDDALRHKTAMEWTDLYAVILKSIGLDSLKAEDVNCHGCRSEGVIFSACEKCPIRPCCQEKSLVNCAGCREYEACDILKGFYSFDVHLPAKKNLDRIRSGGDCCH